MDPLSVRVLGCCVDHSGELRGQVRGEGAGILFQVGENVEFTVLIAEVLEISVRDWDSLKFVGGVVVLRESIRWGETMKIPLFKEMTGLVRAQDAGCGNYIQVVFQRTGIGSELDLLKSLLEEEQALRAFECGKAEELAAGLAEYVGKTRLREEDALREIEVKTAEVQSLQAQNRQLESSCFHMSYLHSKLENELALLRNSEELRTENCVNGKQIEASGRVMATLNEELAQREKELETANAATLATKQLLEENYEQFRDNSYQQAYEFKAVILQLQEENKTLKSAFERLKTEQEKLTMNLFEAQQQIVQFSSRPTLTELVARFCAQNDLEGAFAHISENLYLHNTKEVKLFILENEVLVLFGTTYIPVEEYVRRTDLDESLGTHIYNNLYGHSKLRETLPERTVLNETQMNTKRTMNIKNSISPLVCQRTPQKSTSNLRASITRSTERKRPFK